MYNRQISDNGKTAQLPKASQKTSPIMKSMELKSA